LRFEIEGMVLETHGLLLKTAFSSMHEQEQFFFRNEETILKDLYFEQNFEFARGKKHCRFKNEETVF
jgi:hypothetical protein